MEAHAIPPELPRRRAEWQHIGWAAALVINLPLPLLLGWDSADKFGRVGMVSAIVFVWLLGHLVAHLVEDRACFLFPGCICVALLQFSPIVHMIVGLIAVGIGGWFDPHASATRVSGAGGFVATVVTAAQLMGMALCCGLAFRAAVATAERRAGADS